MALKLCNVICHATNKNSFCFSTNQDGMKLSHKRSPKEHLYKIICKSARFFQEKKFFEFYLYPYNAKQLIDWGLTPFLTISHDGQFTYSCISWFSHTSTPHNNLPKQNAKQPSPIAAMFFYQSTWVEGFR